MEITQQDANIESGVETMTIRSVEGCAAFISLYALEAELSARAFDPEIPAETNRYAQARAA